MVNAKEMALAAAKALDSKKGRDIKVLEIDKITTLADYFVICSGGSNTQINALCDEVEKELDQLGEQPFTARAIAAAHGCCWTTAAWRSMCSMRRPARSTGWSVCGATATRWTSPAC